MNKDNLSKNNIEQGYTYTNYFYLKSSKKIYKVYVNFCKFRSGLKDINVNSFLHEEEKKYFDSLKYERRITSFLLGRYTAKKSISSLICEYDLKKISIKNGIFSQPIVECELYRNIQVSITHCDELAASVAFNDMIILGIDIEKTDSSIKSALNIALTEYEKKLACKIPYPYESFQVMIWTIKESLSKVLKTGLTVPFEILEVKNINMIGEYFISEFSKFPQFVAISFIVHEYWFSITYPKNMEIDIDIIKIKKELDLMLRENKM